MQRVRWGLVILPFLPLLVFAIPDGMTLMPEPHDPWYTPYTTPVWFCSAVYVYPVTIFLHLFGIQPRTPVHIIGMLTYAGIISYGIFRMLFRKTA
jgi:uncharacterized membrane protein